MGEEDEDEDQELQLQLDLSLSMSIIPPLPAAKSKPDKSAQFLKRRTAEPTWERAYAERMRELARRELEQAEREFARARIIWNRALEEVERVESMKMIATRRVSSTCIEITCRSCQQRFRP